MPIKRSLLKKEARRELAGARPNAMLMTLLYLLLTNGVSTVVGMFVDNPFLKMTELMETGLEPGQALAVALSGTGTMALFLTILLTIYSLVVEFGYTGWTLKASRGVYGEYGDLIGGFAMAGQVLLLNLVLWAYAVLWYFAIFIPAAVILVLSMSFAQLLAGPLLIGALVLYFMKILRYSMAVLCLIDNPAGGIMAAIRRSRDMMEGNCGTYFALIFSFFGWYLLQLLVMVLAVGAMLAILGGRELLSATVAGDVGTMLSLIEDIQNNRLTVLVVNLVALPLSLWLTPYMAITQVRYYDLLQTRELGSVYV